VQSILGPSNQEWMVLPGTQRLEAITEAKAIALITASLVFLNSYKYQITTQEIYKNLYKIHQNVLLMNRVYIFAAP
jgi:hypothetical protein